jgi:hypothetical protein
MPGSDSNDKGTVLTLVIIGHSDQQSWSLDLADCEGKGWLLWLS